MNYEVERFVENIFISVLKYLLPNFVGPQVNSCGFVLL